MQGATHRAGGVTAALLGYAYLSGTGSPISSTIEPLASLAVIYPFALWGSTASDLDHHPGSLWDEVKLVGKRSGHTIPSQDPASRLLSHALHITRKPRKLFKRRTRMHNILGVLDCKHRSWQTHSEVPVVLCLAILASLSGATTTSGYIFELATVGILFGVLAHLALDVQTPEGLPLATGLFVNRVIFHKKLLPERIKFVPRVPPSEPGVPGFFSTGGTWEKKVVFNILHLVNLLLIIWVISAQFFGFNPSDLIVH